MHRVASGAAGGWRAWRCRRRPSSAVAGLAWAAWLLLAAATVSGQDALGAGDSGAAVGPLAAALHPGLGRGDFEFHVDVAGLRRAAPGQVVTRVLVQFPVRALLEHTGRDAADILLRIRAYDAERALAALAEAAEHDRQDAAEHAAGEASTEPAAPRQKAEESERQIQDLLGDDFEGVETRASGETRLHVESTDRSKLRDTDYQLAELYLEVPPGDFVFEVVAENLSRLKRGLLDRLRKRHTQAAARLLVRMPDLHAPVALADPVFLVGHTRRQDYAARVYGLLNDSLHVRGTLYAAGHARVGLVVRDRSGEVHWRDSLAADLSGERELGFSTSVNAFPAGQYVLALSAEAPQGRATAQRSFDVVWSLGSWSKSRRDLDAEAELVLTEEESRTYKALPLGEKERYLEEFWSGFDPTPETAHNEILDEFHRRVAYADAHFSGALRGALTHRGKVYVRIGPPDQVQADAVPSHLAGTGAEGLIDKVEDPYSTADETAVGFPSSGGSGDAGPRERVHLRREGREVIGQSGELISYELWIYAGSAALLLPRDVVGIDVGLRLLFVDTQGFGEYELRKSSAPLHITGLKTTY